MVEVASEFIEGRFVRLRPIASSDLPVLYSLCVHYGNRGLWRFHGLAPQEGEFVEQLWRDVLVQHVVEDKRTDSVCGLVVAYRPDFRSGHAWFAVMLHADGARSLVIEAVPVFLRHLFRSFPLRKIYAEAPAYAVEQYAFSSSRFFEQEGRLRSHFYWDGEYHDWVYMSLTRERWNEIDPPDLHALASSTEPDVEQRA